jgi:hypothetical protein
LSATLQQIEQIERQLEIEIAEKQALLNSYRKVYAHLSKTFSTNSGVKSTEELVPLAAPVLERAYGENTKWVRRAIAAMTRNYTLRTLSRWIGEHQGNLSKEAIATVLARLRESGEITEVQKGRGRRPTLYKAPEVPSI